MKWVSIFYWCAGHGTQPYSSYCPICRSVPNGFAGIPPVVPLSIWKKEVAEVYAQLFERFPVSRNEQS